MKNAILTYLEKIGQKTEIDLFFNRYHNLPYDRFAVIKIGSDTINHHLDTFAQNIAFFNKMDMYPSIVFEPDFISQPKSDITGNQAITVELPDFNKMKELIASLGNQLETQIIKHGGQAHLLISENGDDGNLIAEVRELSRNQVTPIIGCIIKNPNHEDKKTETLFKKLAGSLNTVKMIYIHEQGGILDSQNQVIPFLNLHSHDDMARVSQSWKTWLANIKEFINEYRDTEVVITSSRNLLKEIFTIKGCGTYIKYYIIKSSLEADTAVLDKAKYLLEHVFHRKLSDGYFLDPIEEIIHQKNWEAIAIIKKIDSVSYLCKYAVAPFRSGTGLGKALWNHFIKKYPNLIWRSKPYNKINPFYVSQCSGMVKKTNWNVYWKDIDDEKAVALIKKVLAVKESFFDY